MKFTTENTTGFTTEQLKTANRAYYTSVVDSIDDSKLDYIADKILIDVDRVRHCKDWLN